MNRGAFRGGLLCATVLIATSASQVQAAEPTMELGAGLVATTITLGEHGSTSLAVPSSVFGSLNPGLYVTFFPAARIRVEPQLGLVVLSSSREARTTCSTSAGSSTTS